MGTDTLRVEWSVPRLALATGPRSEQRESIEAIVVC